METTINKTDNKGVKRPGGFMKLARKMFIENRKTLLILCGGYLGSFAVIGLWAGFNGMNSSNSSAVMYAFFASLVCSVIASLMCHDFCTKEGRINALMTPACQSHKFWIRLMAVFPGALLLVLAGYYVMSGCMNLAMGLTYSTWLPVYNPFKCFGGDYQSYLVFGSMFLLNEGLFILGAVAWPRKSFLKTLLVQAGLGMLLSFVGIAIAKMSMNYTIVVHDEDAFAYIILSVIAALGLGLIYASYHLFKRATILK